MKRSMEMVLNTLARESGVAHPFIFDMKQAALSDVPFHNNTASITRYIARQFPLHMAVHRVSPVMMTPPAYTQPHVHHDYNEINIIISDEQLEYKILLGNNEYVVRNNSSIWIPMGTIHAANVLRGSGYFIAIRV
jgi:mannose-6-phosphate isomerase-like protein (cupin superfamily)